MLESEYNTMQSLPDKLVAQAMKDIIEVAASDGIITDEEKRLIDLAEISLALFRAEMKTALEDGVITKEERERLTTIKEKITELGTELANQDNNISKDELALLIAYIVAIKLPK